VINSNPIPVEILTKIINGIGRWIERNHCKENLFTFARQYPNGTLIKKIIEAANTKGIKTHSLIFW
jgi:hypothetical protein